jgi:hypothetical protein
MSLNYVVSGIKDEENGDERKRRASKRQFALNGLEAPKLVNFIRWRSDLG